MSDDTADDLDDEYKFKFFDRELLRALGRLTLNASYMEGCMRTMFARVLDDDDLELGQRITADGGFRWLADHLRAISEHRLPRDAHASLSDWIRRCDVADARRNRIVHSDWEVHFSEEWISSELRWSRSTAKRKEFAREVIPATASETHDVARELERLGLEGVRLMDPVRRALGHSSNA